MAIRIYKVINDNVYERNDIKGYSKCKFGYSKGYS